MAKCTKARVVIGDSVFEMVGDLEITPPKKGLLGRVKEWWSVRQMRKAIKNLKSQKVVFKGYYEGDLPWETRVALFGLENEPFSDN